MSRSKKSQFSELIATVRLCKSCPRMHARRGILSLSNGNLDSPLVFIAEAPGRLGADRFGIPLYGDQAGRNFETFLDIAGLSRESVFITNAVLCNPRTPNGNNDSPKLSELRNCSKFLKQTVDIVKPKYVVPLGAQALAALNIIHSHQIRLSESVAKVLIWNGYRIYPLYHPGPRALIRRSKVKQCEDYKALSNLIKSNR